MLDPEEVSGFYEQVGRNTGYVIHPEEIIAENFALLVTGKRDLPSPEVIAKIRQVLTTKPAKVGGASEPQVPAQKSNDENLPPGAFAIGGHGE